MNRNLALFISWLKCLICADQYDGTFSCNYYYLHIYLGCVTCNPHVSNNTASTSHIGSRLMYIHPLWTTSLYHHFAAAPIRFKAKYHPEECAKKREVCEAALRARCDAFTKLLQMGRVNAVSIDTERNEDLVKLLDAGEKSAAVWDNSVWIITSIYSTTFI